MESRSFPLIKPNTKALFYALKVCLSAFILWRIAVKVDIGSAISAFFHLPLPLIALLMGLSTLRHVAQYHNWLYALGVNPSFTHNKTEVKRSYMIGLPLRFALPGGHAAIAKILFVKNSSRMASFWSTTLERSFMTWGTWTLASLAAFVYYPHLPVWLGILAIVVCLLLPIVLYIVLGSKTDWRRLQAPFRSLAPRMMAIQIGANIITYLQYWLLLNAVLPINWWSSTMRMALTQFSNSIPITFAGLGLRESFAIHFLKTAGISAEQAVSATLSLFIIQDILPAIAGTWFLLRTKKV